MKKKQRPLLILMIVMVPVVSSIVILTLLFQRQPARFSDLGQQGYIYGIDVSHHQGQVNWALVQKSHVRFVYIKATEGATYQDPNFIKNWTGSQQAGLIPGAYHYFTFCRSGADQAENFLQLYSKVHGWHLPVAIDVEFIGNCDKQPTPDQLSIELNHFLARIREKSACPILFYTTPNFYHTYLAGRFFDAPPWIQSLNRKPKLKDQHPWRIWQFNTQGHLNGIETPVDLNGFKGNPQEFERFLCKKP